MLILFEYIIIIIKELIIMQFIYSFIFILYIFLVFIFIKLVYNDNLVIEKNIAKIIENKNKFNYILNFSNILVILILMLLSTNILKYYIGSIVISMFFNAIYIYYKKDNIYLRLKSKWL